MGALNGLWVAHDICDQVVDFVDKWAEATELSHCRMAGWIQLSDRKFRDWCSRYGKVNEHNRLIPRDHWLEAWEKEAIVDFFHSYALGVIEESVS